MEEVIVETGWVWRISGQSSSWGFNCGMCGDLGGRGADLNYWTDLLGGTRRGERDKKTDLLGAGQKDRPLGSGVQLRQTNCGTPCLVAGGAAILGQFSQAQ